MEALCDGHDHGHGHQRESFWLKLLPMTGTSWIHVILTISDHFAFLVGSEKCLENVSLIFWAHYVKYKGENTKFKNGPKTRLKVVND